MDESKQNNSILNISTTQIKQYIEVFKVKEKIDISIDEEESNNEFTSEVVESVVINFIENQYSSAKNAIEQIESSQSLNFKNEEHSISIFFQVKTTSKYLFAKEFSDICEKLELLIINNNHEGIKEIKPIYFKYLDAFYLELLPSYMNFKKANNCSLNPSDLLMIVNRYSLNDKEFLRLQNKIDLKLFDTKIDKEMSMDEYGDQMFEDVVIDFVLNKYDLTILQVNEGYTNKDEKMIKAITHKIKANAKYIFGMEFAKCCQEMENWSSKNLDWNKLEENQEHFFNYLDAFYIEVFRNYYVLKKTKKETDINYGTYNKIISRCWLNNIPVEKPSGKSFPNDQNSNLDMDQVGNNSNSNSKKNTKDIGVKKNESIESFGKLQFNDENKDYDIRINKGLDILNAKSKLGESEVNNLIISLIEEQSHILNDFNNLIQNKELDKLTKLMWKFIVNVKNLFPVDLLTELDFAMSMILTEDWRNLSQTKDFIAKSINNSLYELLVYYKGLKLSRNQSIHSNYYSILLEFVSPAFKELYELTNKSSIPKCVINFSSIEDKFISRSKCIAYKNRSHLDYIKLLEKIFKGKKISKSSSKNMLKGLTSGKQLLIDLYKKFVNELTTLCYEQYEFVNFIIDLNTKLENIHDQEEEKHIFLSTKFDFYKKLFDLVEIECDLYLNKSVINNNIDQNNKVATSNLNSPSICYQKLKKPNTNESNDDIMKIISILDIEDFYHNKSQKCKYIDETGILVNKLKKDIENLQEESLNVLSNQIKSSKISKATNSTIEYDEIFVKYEIKLFDYCTII